VIRWIPEIKDDPADLQLPLIDRPAADQQRADDLELGAQIHQKVHRELEAEDAHVEFEDVLDAPVVGAVPRNVAGPSSTTLTLSWRMIWTRSWCAGSRPASAARIPAGQR
jgi:hypothetical protein